MPGYVFLLAAVQALGGGWLACKLVGAGGRQRGCGRRVRHRVPALGQSGRGVRGRAVVRAVAGRCGFGQRDRHGYAGSSSHQPGLLLPAALLARRDPGWPRCFLACSWPGHIHAGHRSASLCAGGYFCFRSSGLGWKTALRNTVLSCAVAALLLSPWAVRNPAALRRRLCQRQPRRHHSLEWAPTPTATVAIRVP